MLTTIRQQLLALTIIPLVIVIVTLTFLMISSRIDDADLSLDAKVSLLLDQLGNLSEFAFFTGNNLELEQLANSALNLPDVEKITITNNKSEQVVSLDKKNNVPVNSLKAYSYNVYSKSLRVDDFSEMTLEGNLDRQFLGRIELVMSLIPQQSLRQKITQKSVFIGGLLLIISLTLAIWTAYKIVSPINVITRVVGRIKQGDLSARVTISSSRELELLADGINSMTNTIEESQKALELKINKATTDLLITVEELTLKNQEINIARNHAVSAVRTKTEFLARMSHEIRTPLNAVMGFCRLLENPLSDIARLEYIDIIHQSAKQLHHIVDDVLTFSKLESNALVLEEREFSLIDCVESSVLMLRPLANNKQVNLIILIHQSLPSRWVGDEIRLIQVINNLVSNAIKFTDQGQVVIEAQYHSENKMLDISVSDTGVGIADKQKQLLFQPFVQADNTITRRYGGAGLGLSISKKLIELMQGNITFVSEEGHGSQFRLQLNNLREPVEASSIMPRGLQGRSILLIDNHVISRRSLRNILLAYGTNIFAPSSTSTALNLLKAQNFDCIIVGITANETDDYIKELLEDISPIYCGPLLCLVSGSNQYIQSAEQEKLIVSHKPIARESLYHLLLEHIDRDAFVADTSLKLVGLAQEKPLIDKAILVVEDNTFNQILFRELLSEYGACVDIACHGREAIEKTQAEHYHMILMDIHMPDMDGFSVAKHIKNQCVINQDTPIIALTADVLVKLDQAKEDEIFVDVVYKPIDKDKLLSVMSANLNVSLTASQSKTMEHISDKVCDEIHRLGVLLSQSVESKNEKKSRSIMHQLKGVVGYFEVSPLAEPCRQLEQLIIDNNYELADKQLSQLLNSPELQLEVS